jgi:hypothetical protein
MSWLIFPQQRNRKSHADAARYVQSTKKGAKPGICAENVMFLSTKESVGKNITQKLIIKALYISTQVFIINFFIFIKIHPFL